MINKDEPSIGSDGSAAAGVDDVDDEDAGDADADDSDTDDEACSAVYAAAGNGSGE